MAEIDVVMSVYNSAEYIDATLRSIQNQTVKDIRIIIVDDGSTDQTGRIVIAAQENDSRIIYKYQKNAGIVAAVNAGMDLCTAQYIARHDGDDISYPERFEKELAYLKAHDGCVAVSALARHIREDGSAMGTTSPAKDISAADDSSLPANEPYIMQPLLMMRRTAFDAVGGYRALSVAEDTDLYWRMKEIGTLHILPEVLGDYRVHASSISSRSIVSGRRMAAWTQLAALSAQRRRKLLADLTFDAELQRQIDMSVELIDLFYVIEPRLSSDERAWLYSAMAAKLLELCYYRPYEPTASDIIYICDAPKMDALLFQRRFYNIYEEAILSAGIRLTIEGQFRLATHLVPRSKWPILIARTAFRAAMPPTIKSGIKKLLRR